MLVFAVFLLLGGCLATADTLLIKSTDGGRIWTDIDPGPPDEYLSDLKVHPNHLDLYALTRRSLGLAESHLLISTDGGKTWQTRQNLPRRFPPILAAGPAGQDTLYLAYELSGDGLPSPKSVIIARVMNGGESMEEYRAEGLAIVRGAIPGSLDGFLTGFTVDPAAPSKLYALITNEWADDLYAFFQALWGSVDGGRNWRQISPPVNGDCTYPQIRIDPSDSSVYLICGIGQLFKSTDGGESWTRKFDGESILNLHIGPGILYIIRRPTDIWKSTDGAETWERSGSLPDIGGKLEAVTRGMVP